MVTNRRQHGQPPFIKYLPIILLGFLLVFFAYRWRDFVVQKQDGSYAIHPGRMDEAKKEKEKLENCEVYKLVALKSGWYMCHLCSQGSIYLNKGEVWKYGYSCSPETRYKKEWLQQMNLRYIPIFFGDMKECRAKEIELIRDYPLLPENMNRPEYLRLVVPPGSKTIKLR